MDIIKELLTMNKLSKIVHTIVKVDTSEQFKSIVVAINKRNRKLRPTNLFDKSIEQCIRIYRADGELGWSCCNIDYYLNVYADIPIIQYNQLILD